MKMKRRKDVNLFSTHAVPRKPQTIKIFLMKDTAVKILVSQKRFEKSE